MNLSLKTEISLLACLHPHRLPLLPLLHPPPPPPPPPPQQPTSPTHASTEHTHSQHHPHTPNYKEATRMLGGSPPRLQAAMIPPPCYLYRVCLRQGSVLCGCITSPREVVLGSWFLIGMFCLSLNGFSLFRPRTLVTYGYGRFGMGNSTDVPLEKRIST